MIRRNIKLRDGADGWILISQIEHAHLAGQLAEVWTAKPAPALSSMRDELLAAIYHHDDGWDQWERSPGVDADLGHPLEFTEVPTIDSLAIWRRSIAIGEQIGPLAAYVIAGHFCYLLERSAAYAASDATGVAARNWSHEFRDQQSSWLDHWRAQDRNANTLAIADMALSFLQNLDAVSLWFCCAERTEPHETTLPIRTTVRFAPESPHRVRVSPWPFSAGEPEIRVRGTQMRAARFANAADFARAERETVELSWQLCP